MDQSTSGSRPSGIPRPSRLPVPNTSGVRASSSRDNLQPPRLAIVNPRLRNSASRDNLSSKIQPPSTPSRARHSNNFTGHNRDVSSETVIFSPVVSEVQRKSSRDGTLRKTSQSSMREVNKTSTEEEITTTGDGIGKPSGTSRKPRPSLSERTMETLQNIPSSPAVRRRGSSFFNTEGAIRPSSRSASSRPTSSAGPQSIIAPDFRASTNTFKLPQSVIQPQTPLKRPGTGRSIKTPSTYRGNPPSLDTPSSKLASPSFGSARSSSQAKLTGSLPTINSGSKITSSRPLKARTSVNGLFRKPSMPVLDQSSEIDRIGFVPKKKSSTFSNASSENTSSEGTAVSMASKASKGTDLTSVAGDTPVTTPRKSSLALRDQIAKAKAAKRAAASKPVSVSGVGNGIEVPVIASGGFDFGLTDDPFNQEVGQNGSKGLLKKRIAAARMDGRLNIAALGFKEIPEEVMNMYSLESVGTQDGSWAEAVDLTKFIAADNELEVLSDEVFPDIDPRDLANDEDSKGNQFGGLETLDLHGNVLVAIPTGLRRLELLTSLNLSNNKLGNDCFQVISQIKSLRDLKLGGNKLAGTLDPGITNLGNLEVLDIQRNGLTSLPDALADLVRLRVLNVSENRFPSLPFGIFRQLPIVEILAAKNVLSGSLVPEDVDELPLLQILDVTANALTSLAVSGTLQLPALRQLTCSANRLTNLPNVSSWTSLLTLAAEDNSIATLPEGFVTLSKVKTVNLNGNNLKVLDEKIGIMESLDMLRIGGNPLRDRKFAGMNTEDLKKALKARLAPEEEEENVQDIGTDGTDGTFYSAPVSPVSPRPTSSDWPVKVGGVLDRSCTKSHSLNPVAAADVAANYQIKILELHHNCFKEIPSSIAFFAATLTTLTISHNELTSDTFLKDELELPVLKELNLSSNTFDSLQPLMQRLQAPMLERLDISFNRLTFLPTLKPSFPNLITLLASHNTIRELSPESIRGIRTVDCSSNELSTLNARIGLLGGPGGLEKLNVMGNRFKVPKYTILEKGTEATLAWLRDKIPAGEPVATDVD